MNPNTLFGLDLAGVEAIALCLLAAVALAGSIVAGFALLEQAERKARRLVREAVRGPQELGLVALWQLERALRKQSRAHSCDRAGLGSTGPIP